MRFGLGVYQHGLKPEGKHGAKVIGDTENNIDCRLITLGDTGILDVTATHEDFVNFNDHEALVGAFDYFLDRESAHYLKDDGVLDAWRVGVLC